MLIGIVIAAAEEDRVTRIKHGKRPVLINTSVNTRSGSIFCRPRDGRESYRSTPLDALPIGSFLLEKRR